MKIGILTICYNEQDTIEAVIKNWDNKVYKHLILHSDKPWHGIEQPRDNTEEIVSKYQNTEFIRMNWRSEHEQRNWGLAYLYDYDYVLIVDADELYTEKEQGIILNRLGKENRFEDNNYCYRIKNVNTYYKSLNEILDPPDTHEPVIAVNPKKILFTEARVPNTDYQIPIDVTMHHLTYCKSNDKMRNKFNQFEHCSDVKNNWFSDVWMSDSKNNVRAYGKENSKCVNSPAPDEIKRLIDNPC